MSLATLEPAPQLMRANGIQLIYPALAKVKRDMPAVPKAHSTASGPKYEYRSAEDVVNAAAPLFDREGIIPVPFVERASRELRDSNGKMMSFVIVEMTLTLYAEDGSFIQAKVVGEASDVSDKASTKAQTVAYRIAVCAILNIATKETAVDPEEGNQYEATSQSAAARATTAMRQATKPEDFKKVLQYALRCAVGKGKPGDVLSCEDVAELRLVALETAQKLRLDESATQWIDDKFNEVAASTPTDAPAAPDDIVMQQEPVKLAEVMLLLQDVNEQNPEVTLRGVLTLYDRLQEHDRGEVVNVAKYFDHPAFKQWVTIEHSGIDAIPGEMRNVTAMASASLIEDETRRLLSLRAQTRLANLRRQK